MKCNPNSRSKRDWMVVPVFGLLRLRDRHLSTDTSHHVLYLASVYVKISLKSLLVLGFLYL